MRTRVIAYGIMFLGVSARAQDTLHLKEVEISSFKSGFAQTGKKEQVIDSSLRQNFLFSGLPEILSASTPVFIKSYGPGALATTAFRGGSASHTALLWNGINIQNYMLGQNDLTTMPVFFFEEVSLEYGGSSSLWGSGAVAGSIRLNNRTPFSQGSRLTAGIGAGSFGAFNAFAQASNSGSRWAVNSKLYHRQATNDFVYSGKEGNEQKRNHAAFDFSGLMQEVRYRANNRNEIGLNAWISDNTRQLPGASISAVNTTGQNDNSIRLHLDWKNNSSGRTSISRAAFLDERINYNDSAVSQYSKNEVRTFIAESEHYYQLKKNVSAHGGINYTSSFGTSDNYDKLRQLSKISLLGGVQLFALEQRLVIQASIRPEFFSQGQMPVTGNLSATLKTGNLTWMLNGARVYRQPTLNEFFWVPGGNPQLKPEEGYTLEGTLAWKKQTKNFVTEISGSAYTRTISNWILWVPGPNANPYPVNLQQVWSRGGETSWKGGLRSKNSGIDITLNTSYVLSTILKNSTQNGDLNGRQLIYTPHYQYNGMMRFYSRRFSVYLMQQYVGYRFTASDNSEWLNPYNIFSIRASQGFQTAGMLMQVFIAGNNLSNQNYQVISGQPMPRRSYEAGIQIQFNQQNQIK